MKAHRFSVHAVTFVVKFWCIVFVSVWFWCSLVVFVYISLFVLNLASEFCVWFLWGTPGTPKGPPGLPEGGARGVPARLGHPPGIIFDTFFVFCFVCVSCVGWAPFGQF